MALVLVLMVLTETTRQAKAGAKIVTAGAAGETSFMVVVVVVGVLVLRVSNETKEKADAKIMTRGGLVRPGSLFWF